MNTSSHSAIDLPRILDSMETMRNRLIRMGVLVFLLSAGGYLLAGRVLGYLQKATGAHLVAYGLPDAFIGYITISLAIGLAAAFPFILHEMLAMVSQRFPEFSHRMRLGFWLVSIALFYLGLYFSLLITLPYGSQFLLDFETERIKAVISVRKFIGFCLVFIFGFGLIFELPVVMVLLGKLGLVDVEKLAGGRRYAILAITIVSAILTPTPDLFNLALMAVPLYLLFEVGIVGMRIGRKKIDN
ncbi:MAG: twin-arginine translocase subunit TatC [Pseudomonadota bacterium]